VLIRIRALINKKTVAKRAENMLWHKLPKSIYFRRGSLPIALDEVLVDQVFRTNVFRDGVTTPGTTTQSQGRSEFEVVLAKRAENMLWHKLPKSIYFRRGSLPIALDEVITVFSARLATVFLLIRCFGPTFSEMELPPQEPQPRVGTNFRNLSTSVVAPCLSHWMK
jgi:hypothetical protein